MIQTYQGYFKDGRFIPLEPETVTIPEEVEVFVIVTGRKVPTQDTEEETTKVDKIENKI
jgi:hypothetical protein